MSLRAARAGLALLVLAMPPWSIAAAQTPPPPADVNAAARSAVQVCVQRIETAPVGLPELEERCPGLAAALDAAGVRPLIIDSSRTRFDRSSLKQLPSLIHPAVGPAPSVAALAAVLRGLRGTPAPSRAWWRRLLDWLSERLTPKQQSDSSSWLSGVLRFMAGLQWLWAAVIWGTIIALPIAVVVIVMREVRAVGKRSIDEPLTAADAADAAEAGPLQSRLALLRQLPPGQRPAQLFAMLIGADVLGSLPDQSSWP